MLPLSILLAVQLVFLSGCAGTARGIQNSVYEPNETLSVVDTSQSEADAMVVIRYPAVVEEDALPAFYRSFEQHAIGGRAEINVQVKSGTDRIAQAIIAKSNYFSMSLFRELQAKLPENSVLLSPHMVTLDDENRLTSRPLLSSEEIPAVLTIDFNIYSFPDPREMMNSEPLTFGDIVTPLFVVHSSRWLRPPTHGLLLSSSPLLAAAWAQSENQADRQMQDRLDDQLFTFRRPLDFVTYLDKGPRPSDRLPSKSPAQSGREIVAVEVHPLEKIRMDGDVVGRISYDHRVDPFAEDFVKGAATRIAEALNRVDHDRATFFTRQIALSRFDPSLGEAFLSRSRSESIRARLAMAEALLEAERRFLASQSSSLYEGTYDGVYGDQMREMIAAEYRMLEERRSLARTQNLTTALAVLAMAGAVYAGSNIDSSNFFHSRTMENLMMLTTLWSVNTAMSSSAESKTVGENFLLQMAPAINRQVSIQLEWLESREEITARDFADFREQTLALYQRSVRSTDHVFDPYCEFVHPSTDERGRWFGLCQAGLAFSSGYGLIIDSNGRSVEYIGHAENGMAKGVGAMILREPGQVGAVYYEGTFSAGVPDGVVLVENPGRKPKVRTFRAGQESGPADADQLQRLAF